MPAGTAVVVEMLTMALPPEVTELGLIAAVMPEGAPLSESETFCALPLVVAVLIVELPEEPCTIDRLAGFTAIEKSLAALAVTVTLSAAVCEPDAAVPVTVSGYVPPATAVVVEIVSVALPPEVTELGLLVTVMPEGAPLTENETVCALPAVVVVVTVALPDEPCAIESDAGLTATLKSDTEHDLVQGTRQLLCAFENSVCTV